MGDLVGFDSTRSTSSGEQTVLLQSCGGASDLVGQCVASDVGGLGGGVLPVQDDSSCRGRSGTQWSTDSCSLFKSDL